MCVMSEAEKLEVQATVLPESTSESKPPYGVFREEYPRRVIGRALWPEHVS